MIQIPCIIFAGGKSSRMGEDKSQLPFGKSTTLLEYQYQRLKQIFQSVYISCKDKSKFNFDAEFIEDERDVFAPTIGFVTAFNRLHVEQIFVLSVDTPFIGLEEIQTILLHKDEPYDAIIATTKTSTHPLCGLYNARLHIKFQEMLARDTHKLSKLLKDANTLYINFDADSNFLNLNFPDEYQEALARFNQKNYINK
jgi:molybdenum cofactor guanylyltransferase